jgi:hypothetical protein
MAPEEIPKMEEKKLKDIFQILLPIILLFSLLGPGETQEERIFNLNIKNRKVAGEVKVIRVKQGDTVKMNWTTDEPTEIHLHGYDIRKSLKPGNTISVTLKAHATGRFSIVTHGFGQQSPEKHDEEMPLLYLEVHPK